MLFNSTLGGIGLSRYVEGDAFQFYQDHPAQSPQIIASSAAPNDLTYPAHAAEYRPELYPEPAITAGQVSDTWASNDEDIYPSYEEPKVSSGEVSDDPPQWLVVPVIEPPRISPTPPGKPPVASPDRLQGDSRAVADDEIGFAAEQMPDERPRASSAAIVLGTRPEEATPKS